MTFLACFISGSPGRPAEIVIYVTLALRYRVDVDMTSAILGQVNVNGYFSPYFCLWQRLKAWAVWSRSD